jgi:vitamin B12 transporter
VVNGFALALAAAVLATGEKPGEMDAGTVETEPPLVGETVVTASRSPRRRSEVPADVTVLDRADLEQSASPFLDDVLRRVPDVGTFRRS